MMAPQKNKVQNMIKAPRQSKTHFPSGDPTARPLALLLPPVITHHPKNGRKKYCPHGKLVELGKGVEDAKVNAVFTFDISVFLLCVGDERRK